MPLQEQEVHSINEGPIVGTGTESDGKVEQQMAADTAYWNTMQDEVEGDRLSPFQRASRRRIKTVKDKEDIVKEKETLKDVRNQIFAFIKLLIHDHLGLIYRVQYNNKLLSNKASNRKLTNKLLLD
jgi:hypothetical protein